MINVGDWPPAPVLSTERLALEPLRVDHADELALLLDDPRLYIFMGGRPPTRSELRDRYARQVTGRSPDGSQRWLNWIVRHRAGQAVGSVQATITAEGDLFVARVAWVIASARQRRGYAREAAATMAAWLREQGAQLLVADVHPKHEASIKVAGALGLTPTDQVIDGEIRWTG